MLIYIFAALEAIRTEKQSNEAILYLDSTLTKVCVAPLAQINWMNDKVSYCCQNTIHTYIRTAMFTPMAGSYVKTFSRDLVVSGLSSHFLRRT